MQLAVLTKNGFQIRERAVPECGPEQVLVKTLSCGICEGDVQHYRNIIENTSDLDERHEVVLGHEGSGAVAAVGRNVRGFREGDLVTALSGCYAEYFLAVPAMLAKLPAEVHPQWAMGEPVACCVHAGGRFGVRPGDRVAFIGSGFMGLVCMQLAGLQGAQTLCALDLLPWRLDVARRLGAHQAIVPDGNLAGAGEFDAVVEAAGTQASLDLASRLVKPHGRLIVVGYHQSGGGMRSVPMALWNWKAIDVINGHVRRDDEKREAMQAGIELMQAGRLHVRPLVEHYAAERINDAFNDLLARREGLFKAGIAY